MKTQADTGLGPVPCGNSFVFKKAKAIMSKSASDFGSLAGARPLSGVRALRGETRGSDRPHQRPTAALAGCDVILPPILYMYASDIMAVEDGQRDGLLRRREGDGRGGGGVADGGHQTGLFVGEYRSRLDSDYQDHGGYRSRPDQTTRIASPYRLGLLESPQRIVYIQTTGPYRPLSGSGLKKKLCVSCYTAGILSMNDPDGGSDV